MRLDEIDIKVLRENFDDEMINQIDKENVIKILTYLNNNGVYYYKDLFTTFLDLFLLPSSEFIEKFEILKNELGTDFVDKLGEDMSLIEIMYK